MGILLDVECNGNNAFLFFFFLASKWKICDSMGYWGMIARWHWIGLQFFWEKLEIGNEKFLVSRFLSLSFVFWKGKMMKNLFIFRRSRVRYCNKILRQFVTNSIETRLKSWTQDIFLSRMRDISWNFELRILFASTFNSPFPFLIYFFPKVVYRQGLKHKGLVKESSFSPRWFGARTGRNGGLRPVQMSKPMIGQK